ncbi:MAG TPA: universal stress protein [Bryobacteraceae bacterium]|nr:universal stress protein [Bryobacteraceae bacterium]
MATVSAKNIDRRDQAVLPLRKILFPIDFSDQCKGAARYVEALTGRFNAALTLLTVADPQYNSPLSDSDVQRRRELQSFWVDELKYFQVDRVFAKGDPASEIVSCAHRGRFDLIMMPTHGLNGFRRLWIGSVTSKVLHHADCPVWTGMHLELAPPLENITFKHFLCAVDMTPYSEKVIQSALELADEYSASLTVIHIQPCIAGADENKQKIKAWLGGSKRDVSILVGTGEVARLTAIAAAREQADLLVIGRNPVAGIFGRLRSKAYSIIQQSPCPVMSI